MIPYGYQSISEDDVIAVTNALRKEYLTTGPLVIEFEKEIEKITGSPTVVVTSGTAALHCAYKAINIKPGDEVITPANTFIATQATAALLGARIRFADIDYGTGNINPESAEKLINRKTKAITAVDFAGHPAEIDELRNICNKHGIYLIEDAAHSLGSSYKGKPVGSLADITTFSFFPTKNITSGEGGAISSPNSELLERARLFARQGLVRNEEKFILEKHGPWHQEVHEFGLNYRLPDILCALGISQIKKLEQFKFIRKGIWERYNSEFKNIIDITTPSKKNYVDPVWHLYHLHVPTTRRLEIFNKLRSNGIGCQVNYFPAFMHPVFSKKDYSLKKLKNSLSFYNSEISLPIYPTLKDWELEKTINVLKALI